MNVKVEKIEANKVKLEVIVNESVFKKNIDKAYRNNVQKFNVPGFRKGKVPKAIIEKMYGEEVFYDDAVNYAIQETYPSAVQENNIEPVDRPEVDVVDIGRGKDLVYTAVVTVKPEVQLGEYKGIEVKRAEYPVTDEDVEKRIELLRERNARILAKEDGIVEQGNTAVIDYEGSVDGVPFEGGKDTNHQLEIGSHTFIEGFEEQLVGKKTGEEFDINVTFPEDYHAAELAGKPAVFKVKINEVKYKELPVVDDEFAKDVSEFDTLDALKEDTRKKLQESNEARAKNEFEDTVVKKVVDNAVIDIPEVMVDKQLDYMLNDLDYRLRYQGLSLEKYIEMANVTIDKIKEDYKESAVSRVKTELVLEKIAKEENITASDEDVASEIENMAKQYGMELEKFKESIKGYENEMITESVVNRKVIDFLVTNAKITE